MRKKALERRDTIAKRKFKMTHAQRQERFQQLKTERLQREREEYENLTPEQKRRRDLRDEKKAKKATSNKKLKVFFRSTLAALLSFASRVLYCLLHCCDVVRLCVCLDIDIIVCGVSCLRACHFDFYFGVLLCCA